MSVAAIIVSAGNGSRAAGARPKQYRELLGKPVLEWSIEAFRAHEQVSEIIVVVDTAWQAWVEERFAGKGVRIVLGGASRTQSVKNGLAAVVQADKVLVHDAARPGLTRDIIDALVDSLDKHDAAAPALALVDTLKRQGQDGLCTLDRSDLYRIQTPQAFHKDLLMRALDQIDEALFDDLQAVETIGANVALVKGHERLGKLTFQEDFDRISRLMAPHTCALRIGSGYDVHTFGPGDKVTLCGIDIPHAHGLVGHSDADAAWHALTDAILGALSLGDIGDHFPPSDDRWKGASSDTFLKEAARLARENGWRIVNCDLTVICEQPKIKPNRQAMRARTADVLGLDVAAVSVKATTTEGLGFTGRGEGLAAQAIVLLALEA